MYKAESLSAPVEIGFSDKTFDLISFKINNTLPFLQVVYFYAELLEHSDQTVRSGACAALGHLKVREGGGGCFTSGIAFILACVPSVAGLCHGSTAEVPLQKRLQFGAVSSQSSLGVNGYVCVCYCVAVYVTVYVTVLLCYCVCLCVCLDVAFILERVVISMLYIHTRMNIIIIHNYIEEHTQSTLL